MKTSFRIEQELYEQLPGRGNAGRVVVEAIAWYTSRYLAGEPVPRPGLKDEYNEGPRRHQVGVNIAPDLAADLDRVTKEEQRLRGRIWTTTKAKTVDAAVRAFLAAHPRGA